MNVRAAKAIGRSIQARRDKSAAGQSGLNKASSLGTVIGGAHGLLRRPGEHEGRLTNMLRGGLTGLGTEVGAGLGLGLGALTLNPAVAAAGALGGGYAGHRLARRGGPIGRALNRERPRGAAPVAEPVEAKSAAGQRGLAKAAALSRRLRARGALRKQAALPLAIGAAGALGAGWLGRRIGQRMRGQSPFGGQEQRFYQRLGIDPREDTGFRRGMETMAGRQMYYGGRMQQMRDAFQGGQRGFNDPRMYQR